MVKVKSKRLLKRLGACATFATVVVVFTGWYFIPLGPFLDDGPFHGSTTSAINGQLPDQSTQIWGGSTLEVFDSKTDGVSAIVQLRRTDGSVQWAIFADGYDVGDVRSVRFTKADRGLARSGTVLGVVEWTYGRESCRWFITGSGNLRDYWYSW